MNESVYDILRTFAIVKNVEAGMTQEEWVEFVTELERMLVWRPAMEAMKECPPSP
jgi:hypothetical protein